MSSSAPSKRFKPTAPLRHQAFSLLFAGQLTSALGDQAFALALPWTVFAVTGDPVRVAVVLAAEVIPRVLLLPVGGALADRFNPRIMMLLSDIGRAAVVGALGVTLLSGLPSLWIVALLAALQGLLSGLFLPGSQAILPWTVKNEDIPAANGLMQIILWLTMVIGPVLGGIAVAAQAAVAFLIDAATFVISAITLASIRLSPPDTPAANAPVTPDEQTRQQAADTAEANAPTEETATTPTPDMLLTSAPRMEAAHSIAAEQESSADIKPADDEVAAEVKAEDAAESPREDAPSEQDAPTETTADDQPASEQSEPEEHVDAVVDAGADEAADGTEASPPEETPTEELVVEMAEALAQEPDTATDAAPAVREREPDAPSDMPLDSPTAAPLAETTPEPRQLRPARSGVFKQIRAGLAFTLGQPLMRTTILVSILGNLAFTGTFGIALIVLSRKLDPSPVTLGLLLGACGVGGVLGALAAGPLGRRKRRGVLTLLLWLLIPVALALVPLYAGSAAALPFPVDLTVANFGDVTIGGFDLGVVNLGDHVASLTIPQRLLALAVLLGLVSYIIALGETIFITIIQQRTPPEFMARVFSVQFVAAGVTQPLSLVAAGFILAVWGAGVAFLATAALFFIAAIIGLASPVMRRA